MSTENINNLVSVKYHRFYSYASPPRSILIAHEGTTCCDIHLMSFIFFLHCELDIPQKTFIIFLCLKEVRNKVGIRRAFTEFNEALFTPSCVSEDDDDDGDGIADQDEDWDGDGLSNEGAHTRASHQPLQLQLQRRHLLHTRTISLLKVPTGAFTFKTLC